MKYFIKKHISIYRQDNKICIGQINSTNYFELVYDIKNITEVENILKNGVEENNINKKISKLFFKNNLLEKQDKIFHTDSRGDLYLQYLLKSKQLNNFKNQKILIFGAGAGGASLIYLLAQFGFCSISVVDFDIVEKTDIHKVMVYDNNMLGKKKLNALKSKIKSNFSVNINVFHEKLAKFDELNKFIKKSRPDFIVKACDPDGNFISNLNKICFEIGIPYIQMGYSYENVILGPILVPNVTSCNEHVSNSFFNFYGKEFNTEGFARLFNDYLFHPSISFNINILASLTFKEILFFLLNEYSHCQTIGRQIVFNPLNFERSNYVYNCSPKCKICKND